MNRSQGMAGSGVGYPRGVGALCVLTLSLAFVHCKSVDDAREAEPVASLHEALVTACPAGYGPAAGGLLLVGTSADDVLTGGTGKDCILGHGGNDTLNGGAGTDFIAGGDGDDIIDGGDNSDDLWGETGNDTVDGGSGNDSLRGNDGLDTLRGGIGDDRLYGHNGMDNLDGGDGADLIVGGADKDILSGGPGNDSLSGEAGIDLLRGDDGNDTLSGGADGDELHGGSGDDTVNGDGGADVLFGEAGEDLLNGGTGIDDLNGGLGNDIADEGGDGGPLKGDDGNDILVDSANSDGGPGYDACAGSSCEEQEPAPTGCTYDYECRPGRGCVAGYCLFCRSDTDCGAGVACRPTRGCEINASEACRVVNGQRWCFDPLGCDKACNKVCPRIGLGSPSLGWAAWSAAQDTVAECQAINDAFGLGGTVTMSTTSSRCVVDSFGTHFAPGGLRGPLSCSTDANCALSHYDLDSGSSGRCTPPFDATAGVSRSLCPCPN